MWRKGVPWSRSPEVSDVVDCTSCDEPVDGFWLWRYEGVRL